MAKLPKNPTRDCPDCPRLVDFRETYRGKEPSWFNSPVPSFGPAKSGLLIIGLAPGLRGANRTGRPFTGDYAGDLLYKTLGKFGLSNDDYDSEGQDKLALKNCRITNAVRCVPPQNKPIGAEITACRPYLLAELQQNPNLRVLLALGRIAHDTTLSTLGERRAAYPFGHNARHDLPNGLILIDSYHCSRYNTNTGRLTEAMFDDVFQQITDILAVN